MIASLKCQYAELLADIGFIQGDLTATKMGRLAPRTGDGVLAATGEMVNHTGRVGNNRRGRRDITKRLFFFCCFVLFCFVFVFFAKLWGKKRHSKENRAVFWFSSECSKKERSRKLQRNEISAVTECPLTLTNILSSEKEAIVHCVVLHKPHRISSKSKFKCCDFGGKALSL